LPKIILSNAFAFHPLSRPAGFLSVGKFFVINLFNCLVNLPWRPRPGKFSRFFGDNSVTSVYFGGGAFPADLRRVHRVSPRCFWLWLVNVGVKIDID
jgi:hypothetical protein